MKSGTPPPPLIYALVALAAVLASGGRLWTPCLTALPAENSAVAVLSADGRRPDWAPSSEDVEDFSTYVGIFFVWVVSPSAKNTLYWLFGLFPSQPLKQKPLFVRRFL